MELLHLIAKYEDFLECQILAVRFDRQQTRLQIYLDYPWEEGRPPPEESTAPPKLIELTFDPVQEVRFTNGLTAYQIVHLGEIGWGLNEIGKFEIRDDPAVLASYRDSPIELHHAVLLWEPLSDEVPHRQIDVVYGELMIKEVGEVPTDVTSIPGST